MDHYVIVVVAAGVAGILGGLVGGLMMGHWLARRNRLAQRVEGAHHVARERAAASKLAELLTNKAAVAISPEVGRLFVAGEYAEAMQRLQAKL